MLNLFKFNLSINGCVNYTKGPNNFKITVVGCTLKTNLTGGKNLDVSESKIVLVAVLLLNVIFLENSAATASKEAHASSCLRFEFL